MKNAKGFSLLEALIVMAILGIVSAMAYPSFRNSIENAEKRRAVSSIEDALNQARIAAIERNDRVVLCPVSPTSTSECDTTGDDWSHGLLVFYDNDADGTFDSSKDDTVGFFPINSEAIEVLIDGQMKNIGFLGGGARAKFSNGVAGTIQVKSKSGSVGKICLKINRLGRTVRDEKC